MPSPLLTALAEPAALSGTGGRAVSLRWLLSRCAALALLALQSEAGVTGDVVYYARSLSQLVGGAGVRLVLQEYPAPVLGLMFPQFLLGGFNARAFNLLFVASMLALDLAFTVQLWRGEGRRRGPATNLWLWFVPLIGPLAFFRFDLVPAVLAGAAIIIARRRPGLAGLITAVGASVKLWPAVLLPTLWLARLDRRRLLVGFVGGVGCIGVLSLLAGGVDRTLSPLSWQNDRGLQIEAVWAVPLMLGRLVDHDRWQIGVSHYRAFELFGPGVSSALAIASLATAAGAAILIILWWRAYRTVAGASETSTVQTLCWLFLCTTLLVTITNKALSPQYLLWTGGPAAALLVVAPEQSAARRFGRLLLVAAIATQLIYPVTYDDLVVASRPLMPLSTLILLSRNVLLLWMTGLAIQQVWIRTRRVRA